ncbi:glycosyltransferase family 4 protein [Arenimonas caeni]|uniref:Glycosyltransferase family 1 protein n=1 Tax=Arenimonas caeni TaxID=2058085 RepID=A0A2P6MC77_9GAMM|nr:glycosyltransferase family 4 protein [Arenimonas caeni]PRH83569.1 glycosyltransferase family 1 protein [Arenimonas caeni]
MRIVLFANTDWYLYNFRLSLALHLRELGHDVLLISPDGPYGVQFEAMGLRWLPVALKRRSLNPLREAGFVLSLARLLRRERPDVIHGFTLKCAIYGSLAARLAGVPGRVNSVTGMGYVFASEDLKARLLRPLVRILMRWALDGARARLILQNPDDVAFFTTNRLADPARIRLILGSGVDCDRFSPGPSRSPNGPLRVLLPARLLWDKGLSEYVAAARQLRAEGHEIHFLLAGEPDPGNPASVPELMVRQWAEEGVLEWLGHVADMPALFRTVDIVALPSYREGLPKGLIEAGACGCALVTTEVPGCREVVTHGVTGLLVPARDSECLADAIRQLCRDVQMRIRLAAAARRDAVDRFDERIVLSNTLETYRSLA